MEVIVETSILGAKVNDGSAGVEYGGVIATTKSVADFGKAM
jgi:hypothetical protein